MSENERLSVRQAIDIAKKYLREVYDTEKISDLGLEEISSTDKEWHITLGFSRPWSKNKIQPNSYTYVGGPFQPRYPRERDYKQIASCRLCLDG